MSWWDDMGAEDWEHISPGLGYGNCGDWGGGIPPEEWDFYDFGDESEEEWEDDLDDDEDWEDEDEDDWV